VAAVAVLLSPGAGGLASMVAGVIMMGWIVGEVLILKQPMPPHGIEVFYFALGLVMAVLGLMAWRV
jgi:hypothetical protein